MTNAHQGWNALSKLYIHNHFDSRRWESVTLRDDDVIISTYPKSGTTREQMTILQLIHNGSNGLDITKLSPYVELCVEPLGDVVSRLGGQAFRRVIKGHIPLEYLPYRPSIKYVDVWRNPFDVAMSLFHHHSNANQNYFNAVNTNRPPGTELFKPNDISAREWIIRWFEEDGFPYWSYWRHIRFSWQVRNMENVSIFHYSDLGNRRAEIEKRADFLGIRLDEELVARVLRHSSFDHMKSVSHRTAPYGGAIWGEGHGKEFFRGGRNGDGTKALSPNDINHCQKVIKKHLPSDCISFLVR